MILHHQLAELSGVVVSTPAAVGDSVEVGDVVVVLESMKCEYRVRATRAGRVSWLPEPGATVQVGEDAVTLVHAEAARPPGPHEVVELLRGTTGTFVELDLVGAGSIGRDGAAGGGRDTLVPVVRPRGCSPDAGILVGRVEHSLAPHERPVERILLCGDSTRALGAVAEPECRRIIAAIDLAEAEGLPLEWIAVSSGARISMESGTENMDWCAAVVRRLVEFTEAGGEVVVVVAGVNVGAQSYWNAEATMLLHCAGILVMVEGTSMVLTGHRSLARAGGNSERSDHDLGGTQVMGGNGQAHHVVADLPSAFELVLEHHALCAGGIGRPSSPAATVDRLDRDIGGSPYRGPVDHGWSTVGEILDGASHPERNREFSVEPVMAALADLDAPRLARWAALRGGEGVHVWDTRLAGRAVSMVGIDSCHREGPGGWESAGTLYPMGAHKLARALRRASGRRPVVVLANLAGFDGSRSSLEGRQLEYGAELARAVVGFRGRIVVVVIGRFHGGAYVVLNKALNDDLRIVALHGTKVSVIGGSSAAEVVLRREVDAWIEAHGGPGEVDRATAVAAVSDRFDLVHDVHRAARVGSVDLVVHHCELRAAVAGLLEPVSPAGPARPLAGRSAVHA